MIKILSAIGLIQVALILVNVIRSKVMAVLLGPQGLGVISIVDQVAQLVGQIAAFSLPFAAVKFLSLSRSKGDDSFQKTYSSILSTLFTLTCLGTAVALGLTLFFPGIMGKEMIGYRSYLIPALLAVPAVKLHGFFGQVLAAAQQPRTSSLMMLSIGIVFTTSSSIGAGLGGVGGFYWINLVASFGIVGGVIWYLRSKLHLRLHAHGHGIRQELKQNPGILSLTSLLYVSSFTMPVSMLIARYAVLTHYSETEAGLLQAGMALAAALTQVLTPMNGLYLTPLVNRDIPAAEKMRTGVDFLSKLTLITSLVAMPLVLFGNWAILIQYSRAFLGVGSILFLFVVGQYMMQLSGVFQALIISQDDLKLYGISLAVGQLSLGLVSWLLVPAYGMNGVAFGFIVSNALVLILTYAQLARRHQLRVPAKLFLFMTYGALILLATGLVCNRFDAFSLNVNICKGIFYAVFSASLLLFLRSDEIQLLGQVAGRVLRLKRKTG